MELYNEQGYLNFDFIRANEQPFNIIIGGRAIGKTYGGLKEVYEKEIPALLIRTTQAQADFICRDDSTPFKSVLDDLGVLYTVRKLSKYTGAVYTAYMDGDIIHPDKKIITTAALSTFHNLRGFDGSAYKQLIYDEFNEEDRRTAKAGTAAAFFNLYETVNRNRELRGEEPLKAYLYGNSNDIFNDILVELKLISRICEMLRSGQEISIMKDRGIALYVLQKSPISWKKKDTALYKAAGEGLFADMALKNVFRGVDYKLVKPLPLKQINPIAACGEVVLYKVKSTGKDYVSLHRSGTPRELTKAEFISLYDRIAFEIAFERGISFDTPEAKVLTKRLFVK